MLDRFEQYTHSTMGKDYITLIGQHERSLKCRTVGSRPVTSVWGGCKPSGFARLQ